jgi:glyoxylase-like metal-dependent hydrolase (beta-lactamase superfamily II)
MTYLPLKWYRQRVEFGHMQPFPRFAALLFVLSLWLPAPFLAAQTAAVPEWCRPLPRPEYKTLKRVPVGDLWFEVYEPAAGVFAIYEPHQSEETISYLITGNKRAVLFDTGMGISDLRGVVTQLTKLPIVVLNSHSHVDHVGANWQFDDIRGMDTDFTHERAKGGQRVFAQQEVEPDQICGDLPKGFDAKTYISRPWKISAYIHDGDKLDLGGRTIEVISTPGHTPDAISLIDRGNGLLFTGDTYYPAPIWLFEPETDLVAYAASIRKLAALAPQVKLVLGAHNIPVANPSVLPRLVVAFDQVHAGKIPPKPVAPGIAVYNVDGFTFRMAAGMIKDSKVP